MLAHWPRILFCQDSRLEKVLEENDCQCEFPVLLQNKTKNRKESVLCLNAFWKLYLFQRSNK